MNALIEFEFREPHLASPIAQALRLLGDEAIRSYASVGLYHNTLGRFVPDILQEGLRAECPQSVPDESDVQFATKLFQAKGHRYSASEKQFDILIKGIRQDREPGVFFYPLHEQAIENRAGYGVPERLHILAMEMGCVMLNKTGLYTTAERDRARQIFTKYRDFIHGTDDDHIAVIRANPFNPNIINHRLKCLPELTEKRDRDSVTKWLGSLGFSDLEGIYVPGPIDAVDIEDLGVQLPIVTSLSENRLRPDHSRFYYTPSNIQIIES